MRLLLIPSCTQFIPYLVKIVLFKRRIKSNVNRFQNLNPLEFGSYLILTVAKLPDKIHISRGKNQML